MSISEDDDDPSNDPSKDYVWEFFERGEEFGEKYTNRGIKQFAGSEIPLIKAGSLAMLAFGIRSYKELLFGTASLAAYYYMAKDNEPSLDGAVTGLAGVQIARKQYLSASFPTFIEAYSSFRDWKKGKFMLKNR